MAKERAKVTVTKKDFINLVAEKLGGTKKEAAEAVDAVFGTQIEILSRPNERFVVEGLATFTSEIKPAHERKNNLTGEMNQVAAKLKRKAKFPSIDA